MNMRRLAIGLILLGVFANAAAEEIVKEFRGSGNEMTAIFKVDSPWLLDWRLDGDYEKLIALDVTLIEAYTGKHVGRVLHTRRRGNGLKLFHEGGAYQLRISSTLARWTFKIKQIQPEDAKLYTPKKQN